jgi:hypothetical protein
MEETRFGKWMNYFIYILSTPFGNKNLTAYPKNSEDINTMESNILWKIKGVSTDIMLRLYEKAWDLMSGIKKKANKEEIIKFTQLMNTNYSGLILETFISFLNQHKVGYLDRELGVSIFKFFSLVLNRGDLLEYLEKHLDLLIKELIVPLNVVSVVDSELMVNV